MNHMVPCGDMRGEVRGGEGGTTLGAEASADVGLGLRCWEPGSGFTPDHPAPHPPPRPLPTTSPSPLQLGLLLQIASLRPRLLVLVPPLGSGWPGLTMTTAGLDHCGWRSVSSLEPGCGISPAHVQGPSGRSALSLAGRPRGVTFSGGRSQDVQDTPSLRPGERCPPPAPVYLWGLLSGPADPHDQAPL